jgi:predicted metalloprotease
METDQLPESSNIEDRRGQGGGFGGLPGGRGGLGIGTIVVLGLIGWALGIDPRLLIGGAELIEGGGGGDQYQAPAQNGTTGVPQDKSGQFVSRILGSTEVEWKDIFSKSGMTYRAPTLVLYTGGTRAACGAARSAMGPFYCPTDEKVYLDTSFFQEIQTRFNGCDVGSKSCEFAEAYVIAHEVGHHVQKLLGVLPKVEEQQQAVGKAQANQLQVRVELQADCLAGVWANHSQQQWNLLQPGDIEAALRTAAAIGDDTLQKEAQGYAVPDSFTHGTSAQRQRWFNSGFKGGTVESCNTFGASQL